MSEDTLETGETSEAEIVKQLKADLAVALAEAAWQRDRGDRCSKSYTRLYGERDEARGALRILFGSCFKTPAQMQALMEGLHPTDQAALVAFLESAKEWMKEP